MVEQRSHLALSRKCSFNNSPSPRRCCEDRPKYHRRQLNVLGPLCSEQRIPRIRFRKWTSLSLSVTRNGVQVHDDNSERNTFFVYRRWHRYLPCHSIQLRICRIRSQQCLPTIHIDRCELNLTIFSRPTASSNRPIQRTSCKHSDIYC